MKGGLLAALLLSGTKLPSDGDTSFSFSSLLTKNCWFLKKTKGIHFMRNSCTVQYFIVVKRTSTEYPYIQVIRFVPLYCVVGVRKMVYGDLPREHPVETTLRFIGPVPVDSRQ